MSDVAGNLVVNISGDNTNLNKALDQSVAKTKTAFGEMGSSIAAAGAATAVFAGILQGINFNKAAEDAQTAFSVMLGSASQAKDMLAELKIYADKTPLEFKDLRTATQTLLQFGISSKDVVADLKMLGDVSAGNAEKLKSLAVVFGQIQSTGHLMGQDLLQLISNGFNPLQEISRTTGESMASLKKKMEAGAISSDMVTAAFKSATSEGGLFYGMLDKAGQTLSGKISTLNDAWASFLGKMTDAFTGPLKSGVNILTGLLNGFTSLPQPILTATTVLVGLLAILAAITAAAPLLGIALSSAFGPIGLAVAGVTTAVVLLASAMDGLAKYRYDNVTGQFIKMAEQMDLTKEAVALVAKGAERSVEFFQNMAKAGTITHDKVAAIAEKLGLTIVQYAQIIDANKIIDVNQKTLLRNSLTESELNQLKYNQINGIALRTADLAQLSKEKADADAKAAKQAQLDADKKAKADAEELKRLNELAKKDAEFSKLKAEHDKTELEAMNYIIKAGWNRNMMDDARLANIERIKIEGENADQAEVNRIEGMGQYYADLERNKISAAEDANVKIVADEKDAILEKEKAQEASSQRIMTITQNVLNGVASLFDTVGGSGAKILSDVASLAADVIQIIATKGSDVNAIFAAMNQVITLAFENNKAGAEEFSKKLDDIGATLMDILGPAIEAIATSLEGIGPLLQIINTLLTPLKPIFQLLLDISTGITAAFQDLADIISGNPDAIKPRWDAFVKSVEDFFNSPTAKAILNLVTFGTSTAISNADDAKKSGVPQTPEAVATGVGDVILGILTGGIYTAIKAAVPAHASGTDFAAGGMALVGEQGPELVNLPTGSQVFTARQTRDMMSSNGGGVNVTINSPIALNPSEAAQVMKQSMRELSFQGAF